jgi:hypothetical protein
VENKALTNKAGMNPTSEKYQESCRKAVLKIANKDFEIAKYWYNKDTFTGEEFF